MPTLAQTRAFFDAIAPRYDRDYARSSDETRATLPWVLAALGPSRRVLDLGVGTGRELPRLLDAGHAVTGVDCSVEMVALCMRRARAIPVVIADFWEPLPFDDASFDAAISLHGSLAHPPDDDAPTRLAGELARVLANPCVIAIEVPSVAWTDRIAGGSAGRASYTDARTRAAIEIVAHEVETWRRALIGFDVTFDPSSPEELRIVARRDG